MENEDHCDFKKLRSLLIRTYMLDLITSTEENHYEAYRLAQMETRKFGEPKVKKLDNPKYKDEEEQLRKRFTEQVKLEESRFRQWEQHVGRDLYLHGTTLTMNSSSPSEIDSTRIWSLLTRPSKLSRWAGLLRTIHVLINVPRASSTSWRLITDKAVRSVVDELSCRVAGVAVLTQIVVRLLLIRPVFATTSPFQDLIPA